MLHLADPSQASHRDAPPRNKKEQRAIVGWLELGFRVQGHVTVGCEPDAWSGLHVPDQFFQNEHARAIADHMRMHGEHEEAALFIGLIELAPENIQHGRWAACRAATPETGSC